MRIKQHNRYGDNAYYIQLDDWRQYFEEAILPAVEISFDACMTNECDSWSGEFDKELLWQETKQLLSFT